VLEKRKFELGTVSAEVAVVNPGTYEATD